MFHELPYTLRQKKSLDRGRRNLAGAALASKLCASISGGQG